MFDRWYMTATGSFATDESAGQNHTEEMFAWLVNEAGSWDDAICSVYVYIIAFDLTKSKNGDNGAYLEQMNMFFELGVDDLRD